MTSTETPQVETRSFEAEIQQLLHLLTHSLYSHPEIFIRELIANASDALDKLRFLSLTDSSLAGDTPLSITVELDPDKKTFTITDTGIGMNREEIEANIGTIARSGSKTFLQSLSGDKAKDLSLIGQFGVGFYSIFMVADRVVLQTQSAGENQAFEWESEGKGTYTLKPLAKSTRGTTVKLYLKEDYKEFLEDWRVRAVIRKFSDYIAYDITMPKIDSRSAEEKENDLKAGKIFKKEWEVVNSGKAIWTRPKNEITDENLHEFYRHLSHDQEAPLAHLHFTQEGTLSFTALLFLPATAPFDLLTNVDPQGLKLYVKRIFIMDDCKELLPRYLRFIRGIVDTEDLPLNVSREILQQNRVVQKIQKLVVKKSLEMLNDLARKEPEKYLKFWQAMGLVLKEGIHFDFENKEKLAPLLRYHSTRSGRENWVSLQDYTDRMKPEQKDIFYITAENLETAEASPHLEVFLRKEVEVLYLVDPVDEWVMASLSEFQGKKLVSVTRGSLDLGDLAKEEKEEVSKAEKDIETIANFFRKILQDHVKQVRATTRLTDSPCCLVADDNEMSANMERILNLSGQGQFDSKKILELNPTHAVIRRMKALLGDPSNEETLKEWAWLLFDQALLAQGSRPLDPKSFNARLNRVLEQSGHAPEKK